MKHRLEIIPVGKTRRFFIAVCSCGKYRSKTRAYPGLAEKAGMEHVRAMEGK